MESDVVFIVSVLAEKKEQLFHTKLGGRTYLLGLHLHINHRLAYIPHSRITPAIVTAPPH